MTTLHTILFYLSAVVFVYLAANAVYLFIIALGGRLIPGKKFGVRAEKKQILVLIPCFKEDLIILDTALRTAGHDYPPDKFSVLVIADKLKAATLNTLREIPVSVLEVDLNMKSRSLHAGLETMLVPEAEIVMILDADNIMGAGCLEKVNDAFQQGYAAIQCHRTAKNKNTSIAWLDAISEEININLFRRGPAKLGLSAAPIGSGMAFDYKLIRDIFSSEEILKNPGEDREIDLQLMRRKIKMEFIDDALVYDEKVANAGVFEKQRVRWLEAQMHHARRFFHGDMRDAPKTFLYFNKFFQNLLLPRILTILAFCFFILMLIIQSLFKAHVLFPGWPVWTVLIGLYLLTLCISIPSAYYSAKTVKALGQVPVLMVAMIRALMQMKKKRAEFLHTPKTFGADEKLVDR
jgi:cellulose synthase/poly-beta-1,6-N-acetylglucosamine synthase-like glycosyltransferase